MAAGEGANVALGRLRAARTSADFAPIGGYARESPSDPVARGVGGGDVALAHPAVAPIAMVRETPRTEMIRRSRDHWLETHGPVRPASETHMTYRLPFRIGSALVLGFCLGLTGCAGRRRKRRRRRRSRSRSVTPSSGRSPTTRTSPAGRPRSIPSRCGRTSGATWTRSTSRKGRWSRRATCSSRSTRGPTRPRWTRPKAQVAQAEAQLEVRRGRVPAEPAARQHAGR